MSAAAIAGYVNPLAGAKVRPERIDQGVDYAGSGTLSALGPGVITTVQGASSGWDGGNFIEERLTAGPLTGQSVFYAEGVQPDVTQGQAVSAGQPVATLIPGAPHGIELGFGSGVGSSTYAAQHGGYIEGRSTAAGEAFSNLVSSLGGPGGIPQSGGVLGSAPPGSPGGGGNVFSDVGNAISGAASSVGNFFGGIPGDVGGAVSSAVGDVFSGFLKWLEQGLLKGTLFGVLTVGGISLAAYGLIKTLEPTGIPQAAGSALRAAKSTEAAAE